MKSRLIGAVLVEKGMISLEQLEVALEIQAKTDERLGEIVVAEFGVSRLELASVLAEQWAELDAVRSDGPSGQTPALKVVEPLTPEEVQIRRPIGEIFVELGFINTDQLDAALVVQSESGARVGEILVEQGSLSRLDLASALAEQWSALQKLRPPAPAAEPTPWQNGSPAVEPAVQSVVHTEAASERVTLTELEERLRLIERATTTSTTQEDLNRVQLDLRAALDALETRVEVATEAASGEGVADSIDRLTARLDAVESTTVSEDVARLREEIEQFRSNRGATDALVDVVAAVERLERRPDRADELERLSTEIASLTVRLDELAGLDHLSDRIAEAAVQARSAESGVQELAHRLDALAALDSRLDELAARIPAEGALDELRAELSALGAVQAPTETGEHGDQIAALAVRVETLATSYEHLSAAAVGELTPRIDALSQRVEELAEGAPDAQTEEFGSRLRSLEERSRKDDDALNRLASELEELGARTHARLDERNDLDADLEGMRHRLDALASTLEQTADITVIDELRSRVDELAMTPHAEADPNALDDLRSQILALSERSESIESLENQLRQLEARIAEIPVDEKLQDEVRLIAESVVGERAALAGEAVVQSRLDVELADVRSRLDELAVLPHEDSALRERVDEMVARFAGIEAAVESLAGLESGVRTGIDSAVAKETGPLSERLRSAEERLSGLADLEARLLELGAELERQPDGERVVAELAEVRSRLDELAVAPYDDAELQARVDVMVARFAGIEAAVESLAAFESGVRTGIDRAVADGTGPLIARLDSAESRLGGLADLEARIAGLALALERQPDGERLAGELAEVGLRLDELAVVPQEDVALRERVDEVVARFAGVEAAVESLAGLESGVRAGIDRAVANGTEQLIARLDLAESKLGAVAELEGRLSGLAAELERQPDGERLTDELTEVRSRLDELTVLPREGAALRKRVDSIAARLDSVGSLETAIAEARAQIAAAEDIRVADALAHGARLAGVEVSATSHLELLAELDGRLSALAAELDGRLDDQALANEVADLRGRIEHLATQASSDELGHRVSLLADRAEAIADEARSSLSRSSEELYGRIDELTHALSVRIEELNERLGGLVAREELDAAAARHVEWFQAELVAVREAGAGSAAGLEEQIASVDRAREADRHANGTALTESLDAVRSELHGKHAALASQLQTQLAEQRAELERARVEREDGRASTARLESLLEDGLAALSARVTGEIADARAAAQQETEVVRGETVSLSGRIDEILGMRYVDLQAGRLADERLAEQLEAVAELRENDAEVARHETAELASRLDVVAGGLHAESAAARAIAEGATAQLADLQRQRAEDSAAAGLARAELVVRIDDLAVRAAESTSEVERGLRDEIFAIAARVEGHDAAEIEAREELRSELERLASSMGWRLERIEESLASDDSAALRETVSDLERRLEGQTALGEEQVRATERALRKGLASLGERLVDSESAYVEAGNTLRRSIERLGAAVVEADARMADQIPVSALEGCVAFAPTDDGYRLIELQGEPPEVGAIVDVEAGNGPLVVTRYGRSPLPFDGRPCAYLDRA